MNIYKLYIFSNGEYAELEVENLQMINVFSLENIKKITERKDNLSKEFIIKGTKHNNQVLGNLYDISTYSSDDYTIQLHHNFKPNQKIDCILLENNIEIIRGSLMIPDYNVIDGNILYNSVIIGHIFSFFNSIKDRELTELDSLSMYIPYNETIIQNSWTNDTYPYIFPQLDYGIDERPIKFDTDENNNEIEIVPNWFDSTYDFKNFRPAVKLNHYINAIFKGFRYDSTNEKYTQLKSNGDVLEQYSIEVEPALEDKFKKLFIPYRGEQLTYKYKGVLADFNSYSQTITNPFPEINFLRSPNWVFDYNFTPINNKYFETYQIPSGWILYNYNQGGQKAKVTKNSPTTVLKFKDNYLKSRITITGSVTLPKDWTGTFYFGLCDVKEKKEIKNMRFSQKLEKTSKVAQTFPINFNNELQDIAGDFVLALRRDNQDPNNLNIDTSLSLSNIKIKIGDTNIDSEIQYGYNDNIPLEKTLPYGVKITDFLKSVINLFNLVLTVDPDNSNKFHLKTYKEFNKNILNINRAIAIDWTDKIDFKNYNVKTNINLPKLYKYNFEEDNDMLNEYYKGLYNSNYGDLTISDSKGLEGENEVKLIFAPSININHSMNLKKLPVLYKADGFLQGKKKTFSTKLRILYNNGVETTDSYQLYNAGSILTTLNTYQYSSMFLKENNQITDTLLFDLPKEYYISDDIIDDYSITQYNKYYKEQIQTLLNDNILFAEFSAYLNETDIANLDFSIPIFIQTKFGNSYFKLLEVEYSNHYTPSTIKLMKIVN